MKRRNLINFEVRIAYFEVPLRFHLKLHFNHFILWNERIASTLSLPRREIIILLNKSQPNLKVLNLTHPEFEYDFRPESQTATLCPPSLGTSLVAAIPPWGHPYDVSGCHPNIAVLTSFFFSLLSKDNPQIPPIPTPRFLHGRLCGECGNNRHWSAQG